MKAILALLCVASTAAAAPKPASHYAPLFEKGKKLVYELSLTSFDVVEGKDGKYHSKKMKPERSTFTCTVTNTATFAEMTVSAVSCDREIDSDYAVRPDGLWVATKAGVWRAGSTGDTFPTSAADIEMVAAPAMRARPIVTKKTTKDAYGGYYTESVTSPRKGTWCTTSDTTTAGVGDGAIETLCFTAGAGITRGMLDYYGGIPRVVEYKLKR